MIQNKTPNLPEGMTDEELLKLLQHTDLIHVDHSESYTRSFLDTCVWSDKKSFRLGHFVYDDGSIPYVPGTFKVPGTSVPDAGSIPYVPGTLKVPGTLGADFTLVICSPYKSESSISSAENTAILNLHYNEELDDLLKKLAATRLLIGENYARTTMQKYRERYVQEAKALVLEKMLEAEIEVDGQLKKVKAVLKHEPEQIDEFFHTLKEQVFNAYFSSKYPKYPKFLSQISYENIKGEVEETINELLKKGESQLFSHAKNILSALNLLDMDGLNTEHSLFARVILEELKQQTGKNVKIEELAQKLNQTPFGLNVEMTYLILVVLTYNGEINLKKKGGGVITSSDLSDVLKSGLEAFKEIPYAILETDFPAEAIVKLFKALDLNAGLVKNVKERTKAVQEFAAKALELKQEIFIIQRDIQDIAARPEPVVDVEALGTKAKELDEIPVEEFLKVKTVSDFKKVVYPEMALNTIKHRLLLIHQLKGFMADYHEWIAKEFSYMQHSLQFLDDYPGVFSESEKSPLYEIRAACKPLYVEISNLLDAEQRRIFKGKLQQYKRKYIELYYLKHHKAIGSERDRETLEKISKSHELKRLRNMKAIRCINPLRLNKVEQTLLALSNAQCTKLQAEHLQEGFRCPWCNFPETLKDIADIGQELEHIERSLEQIAREWEETILNEIGIYQDNINYLGHSQKRIVEEIIKVPGTSEVHDPNVPGTSESAGHIPEDITPEIIAALNALFSEIQLIEISPGDFQDFVFAETTVLDYDTFAEKLNAYKEHILEQGDRKNLRIKMEGY